MIRDDLVNSWKTTMLLVGIVTGGISIFAPSQTLSRFFQTLVVAQASLLGIVISVGLLSVQVTANQFSPLVGRQFEEREFLTGVIRRFGGSIAAGGLGILLTPLLIPTQGLLSVSITVQELFSAFFTASVTAAARIGVVFLVTAAASMGVVFSLISVIEVKNRMIENLNPENLLNDLLSDVSLSSYREYSEDSHSEDEIARSPLLEIFEIGQQALDDRDNHTTVYSIRTLSKATQKILGEYGDHEEKERQEISFERDGLFGYWERLGNSAVEKGTDQSVSRVGTELEEIGKLSISLGLVSQSGLASHQLEQLCREAYHDGRLGRANYEGIGELLNSCIEYDEPVIGGIIAPDIYNILRVSSRDFDTSSDPNVWSHVHLNLIGETRTVWESLFGKYYDVWSDEPRKFYDGIEDAFLNYLTTCLKSERPYPSQVESAFLVVARTAAEEDEQWAVERLTRIIIELHLLRPTENNLRSLNVAKVIDAGGREGVDAAFDEVLSYDGIDPDVEETSSGFPVADETGLVSRDTDRYRSIIRYKTPLNQIEGFQQKTQQLRQDVEESLQKLRED